MRFIKAVAIFIGYMFFLIISYAIISSPFHTVTDAINETAHDPDVAQIHSYINLAFSIIFIISMIGGIIWLAAVAHRQEYEEDFYYREGGGFE